MLETSIGNTYKVSGKTDDLTRPPIETKNLIGEVNHYSTTFGQ